MQRPLRSLLMNSSAALALALCVGAIWSVIALVFGDPVFWMVLVAMAVAVPVSDLLRAAAPAVQALVAALLTVIATLYAQWLAAASLVAAVLGIGFKAALLGIGAEMAWALGTSRLAPWSTALLLIAPIGAALLVLRRRRRGAALPERTAA